MLDTADREGLSDVLSETHPASIAEFSEGLSTEETWKLLDYTDSQQQANIFAFYTPQHQLELAEGVNHERFAPVLEKMSHDDRGNLLRKLGPKFVEALMPLVAKADRDDIKKLLSYPENTAGGMMTTDFVSISENMTAEQAISMLREKSPSSETIYYLYVLDDYYHLQGIVSLRDLIIAKPDSRVRDIMSDRVISVKVTQDKEEVAQLLAKYDFLAMPVTDEQNRLVGIVTYDDAIDVVTQEATEDALHMAGVGNLAENYLEAKFTSIWRRRAVWLSLLFLAELGTFSAIAHFQDQLDKLTVLALFIPLCISTGGNSGSQAATLVTRALALGHIKLGDWFRVLRHELVMGIMLGLTLGVIGFARASLTPESVINPPAKVEAAEAKENEAPPEKVNRFMLAHTVSQAVVCICLWGTMVGAMLPLIFKKLGFDPAYASSPFVATFVDVTGIVIFFSLSKIYLL
ncbi:magnesium transporter [Telmatocola sphagniphila]|uniref:Magnesium transporter MgtE n=1 Tax=Telmatocola sphagniphila TaxID=1123043 RepID=A0A8E6EWW8_9BACT|nr:magnesium transporter [Telmatocola sphagniphila]QVL30626.1 magnesium transporter [Telmatocola sphagniphila]